MNAPVEPLTEDRALRFQNFNSLALKAIQSGAPGDAIKHLEEALSIHRDSKVLSNLGDALARCGRFADAQVALEEAVAVDPRDAQAHYNLGVVLMQQEDYEGAYQCYLDAIEVRRMPEALNNAGNMATYTLRLREAEAHYRAAVKHGYLNARWNLSLCLMMQGRWAEAWDLYHFRPQMDSFRDHPLLWRGESVDGKRLVVISEQGLGDTVYAMRFIPILRTMGVHVVFACESVMMRLAKAAFPEEEHLTPVEVVDKAKGYQGHADYVVLAMSLPGYLTPKGMGPNSPYLTAPAAARNPECFTVGLCWNGSTVTGPPAERNIPLKLLEPLSRVPGVRLVSLQKGEAEAEMAECGFEVADAMSSCRDVYDTACVIASVDLVITVDTLIPHLAGALGKPVWLMNRWMSCWQWGTPDMPDKRCFAFDPHLYPTVAQFRQPARGEWGPVVERVEFGLRNVARSMGFVSDDAMEGSQ